MWILEHRKLVNFDLSLCHEFRKSVGSAVENWEVPRIFRRQCCCAKRHNGCKSDGWHNYYITIKCSLQWLPSRVWGREITIQRFPLTTSSLSRILSASLRFTNLGVCSSSMRITNARTLFGSTFELLLQLSNRPTLDLKYVWELQLSPIQWLVVVNFTAESHLSF